VVQEENSAGEKIFYLDSLADILRQGRFVLYSFILRAGMSNVTEVKTARYPIIKLEDPLRKLSCDISFGNHLGVKKAHFIKFMCSLDAR